MDLPMIEPEATIRWDRDTAPTQQISPLFFLLVLRFFPFTYIHESMFAAMHGRSIKASNKNKGIE